MLRQCSPTSRSTLFPLDYHTYDRFDDNSDSVSGLQWGTNWVLLALETWGFRLVTPKHARYQRKITAVHNRLYSPVATSSRSNYETLATFHPVSLLP